MLRFRRRAQGKHHASQGPTVPPHPARPLPARFEPLRAALEYRARGVTFDPGAEQWLADLRAEYRTWCEGQA